MSKICANLKTPNEGNATLLQGAALSSTAPTSNQLLQYNSTANQWQPISSPIIRGEYISTGMNSNSSRPALNTTLQSYEVRALSASGPTADDGFLRLVAGGGSNPTTTETAIELSGLSNVNDMNQNIVFKTSGIERVRINATGGVYTPNVVIDDGSGNVTANGNLTVEENVTANGTASFATGNFIVDSLGDVNSKGNLTMNTGTLSVATIQAPPTVVNGFSFPVVTNWSGSSTANVGSGTIPSNFVNTNVYYSYSFTLNGIGSFSGSIVFSSGPNNTGNTYAQDGTLFNGAGGPNYSGTAGLSFSTFVPPPGSTIYATIIISNPQGVQVQNLSVNMGFSIVINTSLTITGVTNLNTTGSSTTTIGNASSSTALVGPVAINTTGGNTTTIGNSSSTTSIAGPLDTTNLSIYNSNTKNYIRQPLNSTINKIGQSVITGNLASAWSQQGTGLPTASSTPVSVIWVSQLGLFFAVNSAGSTSSSIYTSPDGINWIAQTTPAAGSVWVRVCYSPSLGLLCAINSGGSGAGTSVATSSNGGTTWTMASTTPSNMIQLSDICWSEDLQLFVTVSQNSNPYVFYSSNGTTWTAASTGPTTLCYGVCYAPELQLFVVTSTGGAVYTSSNGQTWTAGTCPSNTWISVCWSPELSLFVSCSSVVSSTSLMYSPNGTTWNSITSTSLGWQTVIWSSDVGLFIALPSSSPGTSIYYSTTGTSFTGVINMPSATYCSACWSKDLSRFFLMTANTATTIASSFLTANNTGNLSIYGQAESKRMSYYNPLTTHYVRQPLNTAFNKAGQLAATTGTWNLTGTLPSGSYPCVIWVNELNSFFAVNKQGTTSSNSIYKSSDGVTWSVVTLPGSAANPTWTYVTWSPSLGLLVAINDTGTTSATTNPSIATSPDGINWTGRSTIIKQLNQVCWSEDLQIFCCTTRTSGSTNTMQTSSDGFTWTSHNPPNSGAPICICWSPELQLFVIALSASGFWTSPNGVNWTYRNYSTSNVVSICWSPELGLFCAASSGTAVYTSHDAVNWTTVTLTSFNCSGVIWASEIGLFVVVPFSGGSSSTFLTSSDGVNFNPITVPNEFYSSICWSKNLGRFCVMLFSTIGVVQSPNLIGNNFGSVNLSSINTGSSTSVTTIGNTTSGVNLIGTASGSNASAGSVGEYTSASATAVTFTTSGTVYNVATLLLSAGDWDVWGSMSMAALPTNTSALQIWISTTSATNPGAPNNGVYFSLTNSGSVASATIASPLGQMRLLLSTSTNVYLSGQSTFTGTAPAVAGFIGARRVR